MEADGQNQARGDNVSKLRLNGDRRTNADNRTNTRGVNPVFTRLQVALNPHTVADSRGGRPPPLLARMFFSKSRFFRVKGVDFVVQHL